MTTNIMLWIFIAEFIVLAALAIYEKSLPKFLYGIGGAILNIGVLLGLK